MSRFLTSLSVTPLADGQQWRLNSDFVYQSQVLIDNGDETGIITVPTGFCTDFASVPALLRIELPVWNTWGSAAVVHDFCYQEQSIPRDMADGILREACRVLGVAEPIIAQIYLGVRIGGQGAWDRLTELKKTGYNRMASMANLPPYASPL